MSEHNNIIYSPNSKGTSADIGTTISFTDISNNNNNNSNNTSNSNNSNNNNNSNKSGGFFKLSSSPKKNFTTTTTTTTTNTTNSLSPNILTRSRSNSMNSGGTAHVISSRSRSNSVNSSSGVEAGSSHTNNNNNKSQSTSNNTAMFQKEKVVKFNTPNMSPETLSGIGGIGGYGISFFLTSSPSPNTYFNNNSTSNNLSNFSLLDEGYMDNIVYEHLKDVTTLSKQREISLLWNNTIIPPNSTQARKDLKFLVRKGIPDKKRGIVWQAIVGTKDADEDHCYNSAYSSSFGEIVDPNIRNIPAFGGVVSPSDHLLTEAGVKQVKFLLTLIHTNSSVEYCPQLPDLVHILLSFMSEANAYTTASLMIKDSEEGSPFKCLNLDKKECAKFVLSFDHLIEIHLPKLHRHMLLIGLTNSFVFSDEWFSRLFVSFLPYTTVLRIFDVFLNEGYKVLYRIGLALLKTHKKELKKKTTMEKFLATLKSLNSKMYDAEALIKTAFEISLKRSHLEDIKVKQDHKVRDVPEPVPIYYRSKISVPSQILDTDDFELIWAWLPARLSISTPRLLFNSYSHGSNLRLLYENCNEKQPLLIVLRSNNGSVFGFFTDDEFKPKTGFGSHNCFLFTLKPHVHVYRPTEKNQLFMNLKEQSISVGQSNLGEIGLHIEQDLNGKSHYTETFDNPCLNSNDETFQTVVLEAFLIE
ncbi:hypothetical protein DICPUDRAFT_148582 [Dictyostelium purpureum]|uniref:Rab-GAP TBC domain-containing protein n=1 Tax=Dictyostelium purpureum TaxID=5786 RepID=F0ZBH5_DICPU|nr:uncharacterized protein DICPUDRAFT_148582 [Dictyostelium purpureum]EGC38695.1 hypothetical protein DICPUDRAFT_148582 [Dictyostelium purpureum]|eukprot:XP_003284791.1 hypothetical protein DICPUDRAFT_148582 [Dictyostelium purpureum]